MAVVRAQEGDQIPIGGDAAWVLTCASEHVILASGSGNCSINCNGVWMESGGPHKLLSGGEYTLVIPSGRGGLPLLVFGGEDVPAWAGHEDSLQLLLSRSGDGRWDGPFLSLADLRARLVRGQESSEALFGVLGSQNAFYLRDLWPDLIEAPRAVATPVHRDEEDNLDTTIEGKLVCPFCRISFGLGHVLYLSPPDSPGKADPPFLPVSIDIRTQTVKDRHGKVCHDRACPHCKQRLPRSFGKFDYTVFSLVGQSGSGKSYVLATLFHELPAALSRFGLGYLGDDAELNKEFESLSQIPYRTGPAENRFIRKTDNTEGTQILVQLRGETEKRHVPKPILYRVGKGSSARHIMFYDNPGEHFTVVDSRSILSEQARVAASHLAFASTVFVLYDPTLSVGFRAALGLESFGGEGDQQATMLNALPERMRDQRRQEGGEDRDVPLAVLVGKWDLWERLAPELSRDHLTNDGRLDLAVVRQNSEIIRGLLDRYRTGVPAAVSAISGEVVFFPVSAFGDVGPEEILVGGAKYFAPAAPVRPWSVEVPFLWALLRLYPGMIPTTEPGPRSDEP